MSSFLTRDRWIALFCLAFAGYIYYEAGTYPGSALDAVGPSMYPRFLAGVVAAASLAVFLRRSPAKAKKEASRPRWGALFYVLCASGFFIAALNFLGFIPTTALFLLAMVLYFDPREMKIRLRNAVAYAILFSLFLYFFFGKLLGVLLPNPSFM